MMTNGGIGSSLGGEGQRVVKYEGVQSESQLVRTQAVLGARALFIVAVCGILISLIIGQNLLIYGVPAIVLYLLIRVIGSWASTLEKAGAAGGLALFSALWLWRLGYKVVEKIWPPVSFINDRLVISDRSLLPAPLWSRGIAIIIIAAIGLWQVLLAYRMKTEILDPNWPPVYDRRDPNLGPWNPVRFNVVTTPSGREHVIVEPSKTMRIEQANDHGMSYFDLPVGFSLFEHIARTLEQRRGNWSRRDLRAIKGVSATDADRLLKAMAAADLIWYPNGKNDPDGGQLTPTGQSLVDKFLL